MTREDNLYQTALLPNDGPGARLLVVERTGAWAVAIRRELGSDTVPSEEWRCLEDGWAALGRAPASFLVLEVSRANAAAMLERLSWLARDFPLAKAALVADRSLDDTLPWLRVSGVVALITSPRRLIGLARTVRRHMTRIRPRPVPVSERIWAGLPWSPEP